MRRLFVLAAILWWAVQPGLLAKDHAPLYPGFPALRESKAYQKFLNRTYSEFSKILYLIDRYSDARILINYDDQNYPAALCTTVARWFLSRNYKKQTAREWIDQWCHKSIGLGKPIYVKLPDGKFRLAREVLREELEDLEQAVRDNMNKPKKLQPVENDVVNSVSAPPASQPASAIPSDSKQ